MLKRISALSLSLTLVMSGVLPSMSNYQTFAYAQTVQAQIQEPVTSLSQNLIEREISGGQQHAYSIDLGKDQFLFLDVRQLGTDVVIEFLDVEGKLLIETNTPDLSFGAESFYWITEKAGTYKILVKVAQTSAKPGRYTIRIGEIREKKPNDFHYLEAQKALVEGEKLRTLGKKDDFLAALEAYNKSSEHWIAVGETEQIGVVTNLIALINYFLGNTPKATEYFSKAASLRKGGGKAQSVSNAGSMYLILGEKSKALDCFNQGLVLSREVGDKITLSNSLNGVGNLYYSFADHQNALNSYGEALTVAREIGDKTREAGALHNIGTVFASVADFDRAISYFNEAVKLWNEVKDSQNKIYTLNYLGHVYRGLHQYDTALSYYSQVLESAIEKGQKRDQAVTLVRVGQVYYLTNNYDKALENCSKGLEISTTSADLLNQATALDVIGATYSALGKEDKALESFREALEKAKTLSQESLQSDLYYNLAKSNYKLGNLVVATQNIEKALELSEKGRSRINNRDLRTYYFATTKDFHQLYIDILMKLHEKEPSKGYDAQALYVQELSQARTLLDLVKESRVDIKEGVERDLLEKETELKRLSISKTELLIKLINRSSYSPEERNKVEREIDQLDTELEQVQGKIRQSSPAYAAIKQPKPLNVEQIQKEVLDENTILLEYSLGKNHSYLWVVSNKSINSYKLPGKEEIEKAATQPLAYYRTFFHPENESDSDKKRNAAKEQLFMKAVNSFSQMILGQAVNELGNKRLLIVPDGVLQYIPFGGLPNPNAKTVTDTELTPLIAEHEVVTMPSSSTMAVLRSQFSGRKAANQPIVVFGDPVFSASDDRLAVNTDKRQPSIINVSNKQKDEISLSKRVFERGDLARLPFSGEEAKNIAEIYKASRIELGLDANLSKATSSELGDYKIIHFATHGFFNNLKPELSGLVLSLFDDKGQEQNGYLTPNHIYNLKLNADLVVLSACETGFGKEIKGEGILGLTRGFMYAGAERVLFTLWNVNDKSTSTLMTKFYTAMKEGLTPVAALRQAQIAMWKDRKWTAPYYWAAFQLQGEWQK